MACPSSRELIPRTADLIPPVPAAAGMPAPTDLIPALQVHPEATDRTPAILPGTADAAILPGTTVRIPPPDAAVIPKSVRLISRLTEEQAAQVQYRGGIGLGRLIASCQCISETP